MSISEDIQLAQEIAANRNKNSILFTSKSSIYRSTNENINDPNYRVPFADFAYTNVNGELINDAIYDYETGLAYIPKYYKDFIIILGSKIKSDGTLTPLLKGRVDRAGMWTPLPNDIHYIDSKVLVNGKEYDGEFATNPALVYRVTSLNKPPKRYEIADEETCWSDFAFMLAKVYGESGQMKEAVFWENVAMEALVEEFVRRTA